MNFYLLAASGSAWEAWAVVAGLLTLAPAAFSHLARSTRPDQPVATETPPGYAAVLHALPTPAALLDGRARLIDANTAWRSSTRANPFAPADLAAGADYHRLLESAHDAAGPTNRHSHQLAAAFAELLHGRCERITETYSYEQRGEQHWFELRASRFIAGDRPFLLVLHENVTERVLTTRALRDSDERLALLSRVVNQVTWQRDVERDHTEWSAAVRDHFGYSFAELATFQQWLRRVHPDDRPHIQRSLDEALAGETLRWSQQYRMVRQDGSQGVYLDRAIILRDAAGRAVRMVGAIMDVSDRQRAHEDQSRLVHNLVERVKELTALQQMANLLQAESLDLKLLLRRTANIIAQAYQHPSKAVVRVAWEEYEGTTAGFRRHGLPHIERFKLDDGRAGLIEVYYVDDQPPADDGPFLHEERQLLRAACDMLRAYLDRRLAREGEARLVAITEATGDFVATADIAGRVRYLNRAGRELLGLHPGEPLENLHLSDFNPPAARQPLDQGLKHAVERGVWVGEMALLNRRGDQIPISQMIIAHHDAAGKLAYFSTVGRDISDRKQMEQALRESERRYRALVQHAPDAVLVATHEQVLFANQAFADMLGLERPSDAIGKSPLTYVAPDDREEVRGRIRQMLTLGQPAPLVRRLMAHADGSIVTTEAAASPCTYQGHKAVQVTLRDVGDRERAEAAIRESEQRFRLLADAAPVLIWLSGPEGELTYFNRGWLTFRGRSLEQEAGSGWMQGLHPDDYTRLLDHYTAALTRRQAFQLEFRLLRHDGEYRWLDCRAVPLGSDGADDDFRGFIGSCIDITDRKRDERRQKLLVSELDHRVKNTLATILSLAQQQFQTAGDVATFRQAFVGRLHAMARTHEALARTRWDGVDLQQIAEAILRPYIHDRAQRLRLEGPAVRLPARAALPLSLTLHELATNAFKYGALSSRHGRIDLQWSLTDRHVRIEWREDDGPAIDGPGRAGTGMQLIEGLIGYELQGSVRFDFGKRGIKCIISVPLETQVDQGPVVP